MSEKLVWFDARNLEESKKILELVYTLSFEYILVDYNKVSELKLPKKIKLIIDVSEVENWSSCPKESILLSKSSEQLAKARKLGYKTALYSYIQNQEDMEQAWKKGENHNYLIADFKHETNIPLELLIARLQSTQTIILKKVEKLQEIEIAFGVMQVGSGGVVLSTEDTTEILGVDRFMKKQKESTIKLVTGKVIEVQHIGMGYRSCIDTTNLMNKKEGMIIGSTSSGGLLVSSETHYLPYMELRPFRVNAGAVHSYVWASNDMTNYLTELKGGSKVLCVDTKGNTREVTVGRVKTELRPLLKIEVEANNKHINAIVQDDWHIRIFGANGEPRNASTIKVGEELLVYLCESGRHVGIKIEENLEEC